MTRYNFQVVPNKIGGSGLLPMTLTNIRQQIAPPDGAHKDVLTLLGYPTYGGLSADEQTKHTRRLSRTYKELRDAGLFDYLDYFWIRSGVLSFATLLPGKTHGTITGTVTANGIQFNGSSQFANFDFPANRNHYTQDDACVFGSIENETPTSNQPIIGRPDGSTPDALRLYASATTVEIRMNSTSGPPVAVTNSGTRKGLYYVERSGPNDYAAYKDDVLIGSSSSYPSTGMPTALGMGRNSSTFSSNEVSCGGFGKRLPDTQRTELFRIVTAHQAII